jgi:hypothetical protein
MTLGEIWAYIQTRVFSDFAGGYVAPDVINSLLPIVNRELFNEVYARYEKDQKASDDMRPFVVTLGTNGLPIVPIVDGVFSLPSDYLHYSSLRVLKQYTEDTVLCKKFMQESVATDIYTDDQWSNIISGRGLIKPTLSRPKATIENNTVHVLPVDYLAANFSYIRQPLDPFMDYTGIVVGIEFDVEFLPEGGVHNGTVLPIGTPSRTINLEWPDQMHLDFANRMLTHVAQRLGLSSIYQQQ